MSGLHYKQGARLRRIVSSDLWWSASISADNSVTDWIRQTKVAQNRENDRGTRSKAMAQVSSLWHVGYDGVWRDKGLERDLKLGRNCPIIQLCPDLPYFLSHLMSRPGSKLWATHSELQPHTSNKSIVYSSKQPNLIVLQVFHRSPTEKSDAGIFRRNHCSVISSNGKEGLIPYHF